MPVATSSKAVVAVFLPPRLAFVGVISVTVPLSSVNVALITPLFAVLLSPAMNTLAVKASATSIVNDVFFVTSTVFVNAVPLALSAAKAV